MTRLVRESIEFKRGIDSKKALSIGSIYPVKNLKTTDQIQSYVSDRAEDLYHETDKRLDLEIASNPYDPAWDIIVPELEDKNIKVSFISFKDRHWNDPANEDWGWGIWREDTGEIILEAKADFDAVISKIKELLDK